MKQGMWGSALLLWLGFALVSVWLGWQGYLAEAIPYGDVSFVYEFWAGQASSGGPIVGIDVAWVYPIVALVPILLPLLAGPGMYAVGWIVLVTALNAGGFAYLLYTNRGIEQNRLQRLAAWWWLAFLIFLGPIAVSRLDSIITPLAVVGLVSAIKRQALAGALLSIATWIKVSPAALIVAVLVAARERKWFLSSVLVTSVVVITVALILGAGTNLLSFLGQQTSRGLQIEAPLATPFLWLAALGQEGFAVYYDAQILTYQVAGEGVASVAQTSSILLGLGFIVVVLWGYVLQRRGASQLVLLPALALSLTLVLIVFNKVGSPQYIGWLAAPVIAGLIFSRKSFRLSAVMALALALFTQSFYPNWYSGLLALHWPELVLLTIRNVLVAGLFVLSIRLMFRSHSSPKNSETILEN